MVHDIKPIPTIYSGIHFRSKLEAQWAKFFDAMKIKWIYEPEGYQLSDGTWYLPDFYLPDSKQWFEVKGVMSDKDMNKISLLAKDSLKDVVVGLPGGEFYMYSAGDVFFDDTVVLMTKRETYINECSECGKKSFMNSNGSYRCQCCGEYDGDHFINWIMCGADISVILLPYEYSQRSWQQMSQIDVRETN